MIRSAFWEKRPRAVVGIWFAACFALAGLGWINGMDTATPGPASKAALENNSAEVLASRAGIPPRDTLLVVIESATHSVDDSQFVAVRDAFANRLRSMSYGDEPVFRKVQTAGHNQIDDAFYVGEDRRQLLVVASVGGSIDRSDERLRSIPRIIAEVRAANPEFQIRYLSQGTGDQEMIRLIGDDLDRSLIFTLPITFIILLRVFGSLAAALLPLVIAIVSLAASLGGAAVLSRIFGAVSVMASQLVVLLVLALGVDYSLFILTRAREEYRLGKSAQAAIAHARRTTGIAVLWSGLTVALSLVGLFLMNDTVLRSMALVSIVAVIVTVIGSVAVLPSMLLLVPSLVEARPAKTSDSGNGKSYTDWTALSVRRPVLTVLVITTLMSVAGFCSLQMKLGSTVEHALLPPALESTKAFQLIEKKFPNLSGRELYLIFFGERLGGLENSDKVQTFVEDFLESHETVRGPVEVERNRDDTAARYKFIVLGSPNTSQSHAVITDLRNDLIPGFINKYGIATHVSGSLAYIVDESRLYKTRAPVVFASVLLLSMFVLLAAFRSLIVPLKAIILNCLSSAASFGLLVLTFQTFPESAWYYEVVESFVPALLFAILFGLSMDYHLLLLSRIQEEVLGGADTAEAVRRGIRATGGAITSAACIMVSVFAIMATLELPVMKQLGVGLSFAVLIDATLIRTMLLPATMVLLGKWNWYLPKLQRS